MNATAAPNPKSDLLATIPRLRALAISLCGDRTRADDLVQETLVRAWARLTSFQPGSNMTAWLYTILRNEFYTDYRKRRREIPDVDGQWAAKLTSRPSQDSHIQFLDFRDAFMRLPPDHREALILVGASGLSYEDAAVICGCAVGTIKSRVSRARARLGEMMGDGDIDASGNERKWAAAIGPSGSLAT